MLQDSYTRTIDTLRISLTDRCNFRCRYCMPPEGIQCVPKSNYLSFEDIVRVATAFLSLGGKKIRLTGGEPLLRPEIESLVRQLTALPGLQDLGLTTNGSMLHDKAQALWDAGLRRINLSLDTLDPKRFQWICLRDMFSESWQGLQTALKMGFSLKINSVVLPGITRKEVEDLVMLANDHAIEVRFIEFMPLCGSGWKPDLCFPIQQVRDWISERWSLRPLHRGSDPSESYQIIGEQGRIGFIESLSKPFCDSCSRIRLTAIGGLRLCLFAKKEYDLVPYIHEPLLLREKIREFVWRKPPGHAVRPLEGWLNEETGMIMSVGG